MHQSSQPTGSNSKKVLIVDDDVTTLDIMCKDLKSFNVDYVAFEGAEEAFHYLEDHYRDINVVLVDKIMVPLDGIDFLIRVKTHPLLLNIPVIIHSGDVDPNKITLAYDMGVDYYLKKPFTKSTMINAIEEVTNHILH